MYSIICVYASRHIARQEEEEEGGRGGGGGVEEEEEERLLPNLPYCSHLLRFE
jgi:hypothetical protein